MDDSVLRRMLDSDHVWPRMAAKYGVDNPVPPWKTSLDGLCDALDRANAAAEVPSMEQRRDEEDRLSATVYADLPYPENQLVALAHSLLARGVIDQRTLTQKMAAVRARLEA